MLQKNFHLFGICFRLHHICRKFLKSFVFKILVCVILNELFLCIESSVPCILSQSRVASKLPVHWLNI